MSAASGDDNPGDTTFEVKGECAPQDSIATLGPMSLVALGGYKPPPGVLRLMFIPDLVDGAKEYAFVPFPETYEEAQQAAIETLGEHMVDPKPENIQLMGVSRNKQGKWILSSIRPRDWSIIVPSCFCEVFVKQISGDEDNFLHGHLWIAAGKKTAGKMQWTKVHRVVYTGSGKEGEPVTPWINRPRSYKEALALVLEVIGSHRDLRMGLQGYSQGPPSLPQPQETNQFPVKFYTFATNDDTTSAWKRFPEAAYADEKVWRKVVPRPGEKFGVAVQI